MSENSPIQTLLSLPAGMAGAFAASTERTAPQWFAGSDPPAAKLGSGGGTAHLLHAAMQAEGGGAMFRDWLRASRKLLIHGGGQSRRLPAYAAVGKPLIPMPLFRHAAGQRLNQTLLDFQHPIYEEVLRQAPPGIVAMVASGDVLLRFGRRQSPFPEADILALGMQVPAEVAHHFGVFFLLPGESDRLAFFLQKPSVACIQELTGEYAFLVDTGMWLFSERAVLALMGKCGWDDAAQRFANGLPDPYELYAEFGLHLGAQPTQPDDAVSALTCAVVALPQPEFTHLGASRQLIEAVSALHHRDGDPDMSGMAGVREKRSVHILNARMQAPISPEANHTLWIENSHIPATWRLASEHILTGAPENDWHLALPPGVCLDFAPIGERDFCIRAYGMDDTFSGSIGAEARWLGRSAGDWFRARGLSDALDAIAPRTDIQKAPLFPVLPPEAITAGFLAWLCAEEPQDSDRWARLWRESPRLSAEEIAARIHVARLFGQQERFRRNALREMAAQPQSSPFLRLDLEATAAQLSAGGREFDVTLPEEMRPLERMHGLMFRAALKRHRGQEGAPSGEEEAFACLQQSIIREAQLTPSRPICSVLEDQIVWGRSPCRLDLAGGWSDTPPYCLEHGGKVLNVAVNLNGQPPIQVFAKLCPRPELVIRSIDLGAEERVTTYAQLDTFAQAGSEFALAKAALALCGFLPRFHAGGGSATLEAQLREFGGGIEVSLLAAVPAGSGLGTSSILAATLLGVLSELCGLNWDRHLVLSHTLAVEQMLTTGGGWQDQAGGLFRGVKLLETAPGLAQKPTVRWLPDHLFAEDYANRCILLYYTGLTRLAKNILQEIVRGMFLNAAPTLRIVDAIREHALTTFDAVQRADYDALCRAVAASWELNQRLDSGTNTPGVQGILDAVGDHLAGAKLLGAGGGGYLLMLAKDEPAANRIRRILAENPPNRKARFVNLSLSNTGLEITRS